MDQMKIGCFIADMRKQQNMTQKDLAERLGVSDKTVSKWETGKSLPDMSYLPDLCGCLKVNVNELLSAERLSVHDYSAKAEETIMELMKENEKTKKGNIIQMVIGALLILLAVFLLFVSTEDGLSGLVQFPLYLIDLPSAIFVVLLAGGAVLLSGKRDKTGILSLLNRILVPIGAIVSLISVMIMLAKLDDVTYIGPNLAVAILSLFYALCAKVVVAVLLERKS